MNDDNKVIVVEAGTATAYGSAVEGGYTGTYEDFCRQQAQYAQNASAVEQAKQDAQTARNQAQTAKNDAVTAKITAVSAKDDAVRAKDDAVSAKNTAVSAKYDAVSAKNTASTKAQEASASATSAGLSATSADQSARSAEQSAQGVSGNLEQIQTNKEDIGKLKADLESLKQQGYPMASISDAVDAWATEHQYEIVNAYVTPEMFGAVGDGVTDDYNAFYECVEYANTNHLSIYLSGKTYFINGDNTIELKANVHCNSSTIIMGSNYTNYPVFKYVHDVTPGKQTGVLSDFIVNNHEVEDSLKDKFFILDTLIEYGTPAKPEAPNDETIKEVIVSDGVYTDIYWCNDVADYQNISVTVSNITSTKEKGYSFTECTIETNEATGKIKQFLLINRHNITLDNIIINVGSTTGGASVISGKYSNNITVNNVKTLSEQSSSAWGYDLSFDYCANVYVNNVKGINAWSTIANRGLKNYTLTNSKVSTYDVHWNAFGIFNCINNIMDGGPHLGYGNGIFNIINCSCDFVSTRADYLQSWYGNINVENTITNDGVRLSYPTIAMHDHDSFFNELKLPKLSIKNCATSDCILYLKMPDEEASRVIKNYLTIENTKFTNISVPYENICYYATLFNVPFTTEIFSQLKRGAIILFSNYYVSNTNFNITGAIEEGERGTGILESNGQMVILSLTGLVTHNYTAWENIGTIPDGYRPRIDKYFIAYIGSNTVTIKLKTNGNIMLINAVSANNSRISGSVCYIAKH